MSCASTQHRKLIPGTYDSRGKYSTHQTAARFSIQSNYTILKGVMRVIIGMKRWRKPNKTLATTNRKHFAADGLKRSQCSTSPRIITTNSLFSRQARRESRGPFERNQDPNWGQFNSSTEDPDVFYGDPYDDTTALPSLPPSHIPNHRSMPSPYDVDSPYDEQPIASIGSGSAPPRGSRTDKRAQRRGKGRGNSRNDRLPDTSSYNVSSSHTTVEASTMGNYDPRDPATGRPMSPTSLAIARATGQWDNLPPGTSMSQYSPRPFFNPNHPIMHQMGYGPGSWNTFGNSNTDSQGVSQSSFQPSFVPHINPHSLFAEGSTSQLTNLQRQGYQFVGANSSNNTGVSEAQYNEGTNTDLEGRS